MQIFIPQRPMADSKDVQGILRCALTWGSLHETYFQSDLDSVPLCCQVAKSPAVVIWCGDPKETLMEIKYKSEILYIYQGKLFFLKTHIFSSSYN